MYLHTYLIIYIHTCTCVYSICSIHVCVCVYNLAHIRTCTCVPQVIGKIGRVESITDSGDLKIRYPDHIILVLCPDAVVKVRISE